jgi:hypothetical protein
MPQAVNIHLGGEPGNIDPSDAAFWSRGDVEVSYLADGTIGVGSDGGEVRRAAVLIAARTFEGKLVGIEITGRNFLSIAGAVRGQMIRDGQIPVKLNPGIAIAADPDNRLVHFAAEAPLQEWDYDVVEAKRFWRTLREFTEQAGR